MEFNDFYWHDAVIKNIQIDRKNPGKKDTILFEIVRQNGKMNKIVFDEVFFSKMTLGFGVVADECIDTAYVAPNDDPEF